MRLLTTVRGEAAARQALPSPSRVCCRVGALLLNGKWEAAARLILQGPADDRPDIAAARAAFLEKGRVTLCMLQQMYRQCSAADDNAITAPIAIVLPPAVDPQHDETRRWGLMSCCGVGISGDIKAALAGLPRFLTAERTILATLQRLGPTHWLPVHSCRSLACKSPVVLPPQL